MNFFFLFFLISANLKTQFSSRFKPNSSSHSRAASQLPQITGRFTVCPYSPDTELNTHIPFSKEGTYKECWLPRTAHVYIWNASWSFSGRSPGKLVGLITPLLGRASQGERKSRLRGEAFGTEAWLWCSHEEKGQRTTGLWRKPIFRMTTTLPFLENLVRNLSIGVADLTVPQIFSLLPKIVALPDRTLVDRHLGLGTIWEGWGWGCILREGPGQDMRQQKKAWEEDRRSSMLSHSWMRCQWILRGPFSS